MSSLQVILLSSASAQALLGIVAFVFCLFKNQQLHSESLGLLHLACVMLGQILSDVNLIYFAITYDNLYVFYFVGSFLNTICIVSYTNIITFRFSKFKRWFLPLKKKYNPSITVKYWMKFYSIIGLFYLLMIVLTLLNQDLIKNMYLQIVQVFIYLMFCTWFSIMSIAGAYFLLKNRIRGIERKFLICNIIQILLNNITNIIGTLFAFVLSIYELIYSIQKEDKENIYQLHLVEYVIFCVSWAIQAIIIIIVVKRIQFVVGESVVDLDKNDDLDFV